MSSIVVRVRLLGLLVAPLLLLACSTTFETKKIDYKTASKSQVPTLEIPPDLTSPTRDDRYAIPDTGGGKGTATYSAYSAERSPQALAQQKSDVLPEVDNARVERAGNERWLVVKARPTSSGVRSRTSGRNPAFVIKIDLPDAGVMETDWAENRAKISQDFIRNILGKVIDSVYSTAERDKFRTRLEPGITPGTTDIFISHRGMYEVFVSEGKDQTKWQPRPPDPELEAEMLRR
jgi:outer membrane protein assembly factor BamC